jgi:hypothetical protein
MDRSVNYIGVLKNNRKKKRFGGDVPRRRRDCLSHLIDRLEACPTTLHHAPILIGYGHKTFENYYRRSFLAVSSLPLGFATLEIIRGRVARGRGVFADISRGHKMSGTARPT